MDIFQVRLAENCSNGCFDGVHSFTVAKKREDSLDVLEKKIREQAHWISERKFEVIEIKCLETNVLW